MSSINNQKLVLVVEAIILRGKTSPVRTEKEYMHLTIKVLFPPFLGGFA